ncbi:MAG: hypothetical protein VW498_02095 [Candidatus Thalassarchaeaceae archaeon]
MDSAIENYKRLLDKFIENSIQRRVAKMELDELLSDIAMIQYGDGWEDGKEYMKRFTAEMNHQFPMSDN